MADPVLKLDIYITTLPISEWWERQVVRISFCKNCKPVRNHFSIRVRANLAFWAKKAGRFLKTINKYEKENNQQGAI